MPPQYYDLPDPGIAVGVLALLVVAGVVLNRSIVEGAIRNALRAADERRRARDGRAADRAGTPASSMPPTAAAAVANDRAA